MEIQIIQIHHGINLRDAINIARKLGCSAMPKHRTGEYTLRHSAVAGRIVFNGRRKDAPREVTQWLRRLVRVISGSDNGNPSGGLAVA
jgi:hypothetical protein